MRGIYPSAGPMLVSSYNFSLVLWSLFVAVLAAYTALDMAARVASARGAQAGGWLVGGALAMGLGIWSMHFVGMLAFSLPIPVGYDPLLTAVSLLLAVVASGFALWIVCRPALPLPRLLAGGLFLAAGIAGMHYLGMAAMHMHPAIQYQPGWFVTSLLIAYLASVAALWAAFKLRGDGRKVWLQRVAAAAIMGMAIAGMHYVGMAAAQFPAHTQSAAGVSGFNTQGLAGMTIVITVIVLGGALLVSLFDMRAQSQTHSLSQATRELKYLALHDSLTGLPNRTLLEDRIDRALVNVRRDGGRFALLMMDLDGFRVVNDAYGHHVGDRLLLEVARRVQSHIRGQDTLARLAGDEFVLLMDIVEPADAATQAHKVLSFIKKPFHVAGQEIHVSASVGITLCPDDGNERHDLLAQADAARHHAKNAGRNTYSFFEASMHANVQQQLSLLQDFRKALENNELSLAYQPKLHVASGKISGAEALLRWWHDEHGQVAPDRFIPLAERTGLIVPIGEWVLDRACRQVREWQDDGWVEAAVAVNLSPMQFRHSGLVATVRTILNRYGLKPQSLTLEITESTAMHDTESSIVILQRLCDLGVRIAIDDFGTGYSSLLYLKRLPVDELKIDRGFVRDLAPETEDRAIVGAVAALAQTLGLEVVAEGVETQTQFEVLSQLGCDYLQGYLLGRPMAPDALLDRVMKPSDFPDTYP